MVKIDKNRVQELAKELRDVAIPKHQHKYWKLKDNLTREQLIGLERLLIKESRKTRKGEHKWSKEIKEALFSLYPWLHPCCFLRNVREALSNDNYCQQVEQAEINLINSKKISEKQLLNNLSKELSNQNKKKEEKVAEIFAFCLDYLNQGEREDWKKGKYKTQMLLALAENEWKNTKKQMFKNYINKEVVEKMKF